MSTYLYAQGGILHFYNPMVDLVQPAQRAMQPPFSPLLALQSKTPNARRAPCAAQDLTPRSSVQRLLIQSANHVQLASAMNTLLSLAHQLQTQFVWRAKHAHCCNTSLAIALELPTLLA